MSTSSAATPPGPRRVTLAMPAHAYTRPAPDDIIPLTCNEIQHLFATLVVQPPSNAAHRLRWSEWRRRHQARSRTSHYRRQAATQA